MSAMGILCSELYRRHVTGDGHPETTARLEVVRETLHTSGVLARYAELTPRDAEPADIQLVHTHDYLIRLDAACRQGYPYIDVPDSSICPESYAIAKLAAGGVAHAARQIAGGNLRRAFCAVRPPGHHAESDRSMGFCLLNNIAIAARVVQKEFNLDRIVILDFDVHHGNGTQHAFDADPGVTFISLHGHPKYLYPGTGFDDEVGVGPGRGYTINIPFLPGAKDADYRAAFENQVIPAIERYAPKMIFVSAGFDAHADDPLGNLDLTDEIFGWMTEVLVDLAERHAHGRVLSVLEGGYNHDVLRRCVPQHVEKLSAGCA